MRWVALIAPIGQEALASCVKLLHHHPLPQELQQQEEVGEERLLLRVPEVL
jgi:hypothetical protein